MAYLMDFVIYVFKQVKTSVQMYVRDLGRYA